jgi:hypothetical protein
MACTALGAALVFAVAIGGPQAFAAEPQTQQAGAVEPAAAQLLRTALERIAAARSLSFVAEITSDRVLPSGQRVQQTGKIETAVRRPDGMRVAFDGEQRSTRSWYDGRTFTLLDVGQNVYACSPGEGRLDDLLETIKERLGFTPPLTLLLYEDVATSAFKRVKRGFTVGPANLGGVAVQHLAFDGEKTGWQFWVTEDREPVIKRLVVTFKNREGAPQFSATFLAWDFGPRLSDDLFTFVPPPGAVQCDFQLLKR